MQNYGLDDLIDHDVRYAMAEEWIQVVDALWRSWDQDAVRLDEEEGVYADHAKVRAIDFKGRFHAVRGPLNTLPPPQGRPVVFQAGGSPAGRDFGARNADIVMADAMTPAAMKAYRDDIRGRRTRAGRDPDACKVLFLLRVFLGETAEEADARRQDFRAYEAANVERRLAGLSAGTGIDFSRFDLDAPLPPVSTEGHQSVLAAFAAKAPGLTLRDAACLPNKLELTGTPDGVAAQMGALMDEVGGDGFLLMNPVTRRTIAEVTDGLAPALARRGLCRSAYSAERFRDNLLAF